jgi:hypothetical protein
MSYKIAIVVVEILAFIGIVAVLGVAQPSTYPQSDWMLKAKETDDMIFGRFNVDCFDIYGSDVDLCQLNQNFVNSTNFSVNYMQLWTSTWFYNKTEINTMLGDYYTKVQSDSLYSPIIWAYNQTTPAISFVQNWIVNGYFNKTESDARYIQSYPDFSATHINYITKNYTINSSSTPITIEELKWNITANATSPKWTSFNCFITYQSTDAGTGIGFAIDMLPNNTAGLISYTANIPKATDGTGSLYTGYGMAVNDFILSPNTPTKNQPYTADFYGNLRLDGNTAILVKFKIDGNRNVTVHAGSECRWWSHP